MLYSSLLVLLVIGTVASSPEVTQEDHATNQDAETTLDHVAPLEKRSPRYDFGLGKRAYSYVSEYKRLPVYNFGLGKRSRPYSFGLGKRSVDEEQAEEFPNDIDQNTYAEAIEQYDDAPVYEVKRARPYSFGLGKRLSEDTQDSEEKRARYDFGLGKRPNLYNFGLGKRARSYNFGLGKRLSSKFNFGLGKRLSSKFNFGLGKRSADMPIDDNEYYDV